MNRLATSLLAVLLTPLATMHAADAPQPAKPNIVYILCDDLGYGDVHCLNPERGKIATPNMDRFASQGMVFTDAHATSSVCTPSRYSILTGRYNWRSRLQKGVLGAYDGPLIAADRLTLPQWLKEQGYCTVGVGKWHLGFDLAVADNHVRTDQPARNGPLTRGFDSFFCLDLRVWSPFMFIEDDHFTGTSLMKHARMGATIGGKGAPKIDDYAHCLPATTDRAVESVERLAKSGKPFFLFCAFHAPHTPLAVAKPWKGKSAVGLYGDYVMETDAEIGRVLDAIETNSLADNTLVILTSDNGCAPYVGVSGKTYPGAVHELEAKGHFPSAQFRGYKSDAWDGGHRIPFMVRWPGVVKPGTTCGQLACEMDLMATCAEITGGKIPNNAAEDSVSLLPLLRGGDEPVRETLVHHSIHGDFAIRDGKWKLVLCPGSGGWSPPPAVANGEIRPAVQLYDTTQDVGERKNLEAEEPQVVVRLTALLNKIIADGRSTPGPRQTNDVPVHVLKKCQ